MKINISSGPPSMEAMKDTPGPQKLIWILLSLGEVLYTRRLMMFFFYIHRSFRQPTAKQTTNKNEPQDTFHSYSSIRVLILYIFRVRINLISFFLRDKVMRVKALVKSESSQKSKILLCASKQHNLQRLYYIKTGVVTFTITSTRSHIKISFCAKFFSSSSHTGLFSVDENRSHNEILSFTRYVPSSHTPRGLLGTHIHYKIFSIRCKVMKIT